LVIQQKRKSDLDASDSDEDSRKKHLKLSKEKDEKDKSNYKDLGNMVKNQNQVSKWKVVGSKYKKTFTREIMASTPAFKESGLITCNKWLVQGFCYKKCNGKTSHKPFSSTIHKSAYDKW